MIREQQEFERKFGKILDAEAVKTKQEAEAFFEEKQKVSFLLLTFLDEFNFETIYFLKLCPIFVSSASIIFTNYNYSMFSQKTTTLESRINEQVVY